MIPYVKPRIMKKELEDVRNSLWERDYRDQKKRNFTGITKHNKFNFGSLSLNINDFNELFIKDDWGTKRVSPTGAQLLLLLDKEGFFQRKSLEKPIELIKYANSEAAIIKAQNDYEAEERRKRELALTPELVKETDFSYGLLNNIFINRFGLGRERRTMLIGGIEVTKDVAVYKSNSGKSSDSSVVFQWCSADGQNHVIAKESVYSGNRRNDAERNWGLPE